MPSGSTSTWNFAGGADLPGTSKSISTSTAVPRIPMVATGVSTFMSPCLAVAPATKEIVPATRLSSDDCSTRWGRRSSRSAPSSRSREAEHAAVDKGDAEHGMGTGLDHVALVDVVALVQNDRDAVADRGRIAHQLSDVADHGGACWRCRGLRELGVTGQRIDEVAGEVGAVGRGQRRPLSPLKYSGSTSSRSLLVRIRSTPERLKSPLNSR